MAHSREKVWRAVTEPEHLAVWYPQEIVGERRAGAPLRFVSSASSPPTERVTEIASSRSATTPPRPHHDAHVTRPGGP
ncbi:MAG TPA: SRPBCC domain-containing protein [Trebonia sp.]|nr:SRPBCC domain-containing protein [Trebonia sp.]